MSVLTLILPLSTNCEYEQLLESFTESVNNILHSQVFSQKAEKNEALINIVSEHKGDNFVLYIKPNLPQFELIKHGDALYKAVAEWLAAYIVQQHEKQLLHQAIRKKGFTQPDIIQKIETYCQSILNHEQWDGLSRIYTEVDRKRRINKIVHELHQFFSYEVICQLEGLLAFRLRPYKKEIKDIVDYACDEYVMNQQYEEFISLLKYFVQIQECKIDIVHIIQEDRGIQLYDEQLKPIVLNDYEDRIVVDMLENEINLEDSVISHLVAVSPKKIVIHPSAKEWYETKTLKSIFADRVEVCNSCHLCMTPSSEILPIH